MDAAEPRSVAHGLVWALLALALLWAGLRGFENLNLYIPSREHGAHPGTYRLPYEDVWLEAADGGRAHAWFIPGPGPRVAVVFHGNAGNISNRLEKAQALRRAGLSVLLFDYRGYGKSPGRPSERGLYADGEAAALEAARRAGGDWRKVAYYGESLGCAVALETALRRPPGALVLDSPFTSTVAMGRIVLPFLPVEHMVRQRYDNLAKAGRLRAPLLVLHSPDDEVIPSAMGQLVWAAAPEPKRFVETRGGHNEGFLESPNWEPELAAFLTSNLK